MLTTEQRERYRRDGYIVIPGFKSAGDSVDAFDPATSRGRIVGYVRVSSVGQNTARQLDDIELGRVFEAKCSGGECKAHKFD